MKYKKIFINFLKILKFFIVKLIIYYFFLFKFNFFLAKFKKILYIDYFIILKNLYLINELINLKKLEF